MVIALIYAASLSVFSFAVGGFYERCRWVRDTDRLRVRLLFLLDDADR